MIHTLSIQAEPPPLHMDDGNVVRVGKSRVSLDVLVEQYENGMTPEDLVRAYDSLHLADVYSAIAFYLQHRDEVRAYLDRRHAEAQEVRRKVESSRPGISREALLARRKTMERADASAGQ